MNDDEFKKKLFGIIFFVANRLEVLSNRRLAGSGLTVKQWMLLIIAEKSSDSKVKISDAARELGTSHQNIKQMASSLEQKGFIKITRNPDDRRALILAVTEKSKKYWEERHMNDNAFIETLMGNFDSNEIETFTGYLFRLYAAMGEKS